MNCKADIAFMLNPAAPAKAPVPSCTSPDRADCNVEEAMSPSMSLFRSLSPVEPRTPSLLYRQRLVAPYMTPMEKRLSNLRHYGSKSSEHSIMSMAALCISSDSSSSCSSEDGHSETAGSISESKIRVRKTHTPPCQVEDCPNLAVSHGRCVRHGGGSRCTFPECTKRAKLYQRCFQHGGFKMCTEPGCTRKAKRYGHCWSHGGGHICEAPECTKVSTQGGFCWAHGGGNRCKHEGCNRRSYQRCDYYCMRHAKITPTEATATSVAETETSS